LDKRPDDFSARALDAQPSALQSLQLASPELEAVGIARVAADIRLEGVSLLSGYANDAAGISLHG
jgi:hypothetical protein